MYFSFVKFITDLYANESECNQKNVRSQQIILPSENNRKRNDETKSMLWSCYDARWWSWNHDFSFHFNEQQIEVTVIFSVRFMISIFSSSRLSLLLLLFRVCLAVLYWFRSYLVCLCVNRGICFFFHLCFFWISFPTSLLWRRRVTRWNKNIFLPVVALK